MSASLAYRRNEAAILSGDAPEKYTRILPHVPGERILEAGSAEGVLACLLAKEGKAVTAIEADPERHAGALALADNWGVSGVTFIRDHLQMQLPAIIPGQFDTLVAVRMIYYLRGSLDAVFASVAARIPNVVLCGNANRARRYHAGTPDEPLGEFNYYASAEGMRELLVRHGYRIVDEVLDGDAIIVGQRA